MSDFKLHEAVTCLVAGVVVAVYPNGYLVELFDGDNNTIDVVWCPGEQLRKPVESGG